MSAVVRMSVCSFWCSFTTWFRLFLFNLFFFFFFFLVGFLSFWCRGWSGILLIFLHSSEVWPVSCPQVVQLQRSTPFQLRSGFHGTKGCPQADILNFVQFVGVRLGCCRSGTVPIFQRWADCSHVVGTPVCSRQFL